MPISLIYLSCCKSCSAVLGNSGHSSTLLGLHLQNLIKPSATILLSHLPLSWGRLNPIEAQLPATMQRDELPSPCQPISWASDVTSPIASTDWDHWKEGEERTEGLIHPWPSVSPALVVFLWGTCHNWAVRPRGAMAPAGSLAWCQAEGWAW